MTTQRQPTAPRALQEPDGDEVRFGYFLLQAQVRGPARILVRLTIEDLGSATKATFGSARELMRFLEGWGGTRGDERWAPLPIQATDVDVATNQSRRHT